MQENRQAPGVNEILRGISAIVGAVGIDAVSDFSLEGQEINGDLQNGVPFIRRLESLTV